MTPNAWGSFEPAEPVSITTLMPRPPWTEFPHIDYGGDGESTMVVCGYLRGDAVLFDPVLRALPSLFVVHPPPGPATTWVNASVEYALTVPAAVPGSVADGPAAGRAAVHRGAADLPRRERRR